jgi:hypothetical protein
MVYVNWLHVNDLQIEEVEKTASERRKGMERMVQGIATRVERKIPKRSPRMERQVSRVED